MAKPPPSVPPSQVALAESARVAAIAAQIAGELYRASQVARKLALVAQNSRTMVARVGEQAAGLDVLSEYFAELSRDTIRLSGEVNLLATRIAGNSVANWRVLRFVEALRESTRWNDSDGYTTFTRGQIECTSVRAREQQEQFSEARAVLARRLDELDTYMRSASTLAVNFRLEATKTGAFEAVLRNLAADLDILSKTIGEHAQRSIVLLKEMRSFDAFAQAV